MFVTLPTAREDNLGENLKNNVETGRLYPFFKKGTGVGGMNS